MLTEQERSMIKIVQFCFKKAIYICIQILLHKELFKFEKNIKVSQIKEAVTL